MDIQAYKLALIEKLLQVNEETILYKIGACMDENEGDLWDTLSEGEKRAFQQGLKDLEEGRTIPYETSRKNLLKKFPQLDV